MATKQDLLSERGLPSNVEAERSIIGAIMLDNAVCDEAQALITAKHFSLETHRRIWRAITYLWEQGQPIDLITLTDILKRRNQFDSIGGATFLASLIDGVPRTDTIAPYAKIVRGKYILRSLVTTADLISNLALDADEEPEDLLEKAERFVYEIGDDLSNQHFKTVGELAHKRLIEVEQASEGHTYLTGIPTGFTDFDEMTAGLQRQDLIIIAARPSQGKTAMGLNMVQFAAATGKTVGIFSLEMSGEQLISRLLCSEARVDSHRFRTGRLNREEWARLSDALRRLSELRLFIDDSTGLNVPAMKTKARRLKKEHGLDLLLIDYLQLMAGRGKTENRQQEVSQISRDLKGMAKEFDVPVIALSQLSRAPEGRSDHRPQLSDLRESGAIEQDCDIAAFIFREEQYCATDANRGLAELIIAKQRNGPTGAIGLTFLKEFTRFENMWRE